MRPFNNEIGITVGYETTISDEINVGLDYDLNITNLINNNYDWDSGHSLDFYPSDELRFNLHFLYARIGFEFGQNSRY